MKYIDWRKTLLFRHFLLEKTGTQTFLSVHILMDKTDRKQKGYII